MATWCSHDGHLIVSKWPLDDHLNTDSFKTWNILGDLEQPDEAASPLLEEGGGPSLEGEGGRGKEEGEGEER